MNHEQVIRSLTDLLTWCDRNKNNVFLSQLVAAPPDMSAIKKRILDLAYHYETKNPVYKAELHRISENIFIVNGGYWFIYPVVFGQLYMLLKILFEEEKNESFDWWSYMHPRVAEVSRKKFEDQHFSDAVETALKDICAIVRTYRKANGYQEIISDSSMLRNTFKPESDMLLFTDGSDDTQRSIQKGYENLFAGAMEAMRNPSTHAVLDMDSAESARKLMFASDLMYMLDTALNRKERTK